MTEQADAPPADKRYLAAILAADVVGYSGMMEASEQATLSSLRALRVSLFQPKVEEYRGRIFKTMGDGFLVEFASVADAVCCAVDIQRALADFDIPAPEAQKIRMRIGVNLGDVFREGDDLYGDGVNVAARLEGLAAPGGVCVSRAVREQIRGDLGFDFVDLGDQKVKNIARPIRVFGLQFDGVQPKLRTVPGPVKPRLPRALFGAGLTLVLALGATFAALTNSKAPATTSLPMLSVALLPIENKTGEPALDASIDRVTENIIAVISRNRTLTIAPRNAVFALRSQSIDERQAGKALKMRHVATMSVRKTDGAYRAVLQITDAQDGGIISSEDFALTGPDRPHFEDRLSLATVDRITSAISDHWRKDQLARPPSDADFDNVLARSQDLWGHLRQDQFEKLLQLVDLAGRLAGQDAERKVRLNTWVCTTYFDLLVSGFARTVVDRGSVAQAGLAASDVISATAPNSVNGPSCRAIFLGQLGRLDEAIAVARYAVEHFPMASGIYDTLAYLEWRHGNFAEAVRASREYAERSNDKKAPIYVGWNQLFAGDYDEAISSLREGAINDPTDDQSRFALVAAYQLAGHNAEARGAVQDYLEVSRHEDSWSFLSESQEPRFVAAALKIRAALHEAGLDETSSARRN